MRQVVCGRCNGTGEVTEYEPWESALRQIDRAIEIVGNGWAPELFSVDVEGSYPAAFIRERYEDLLESLERQLHYWAMHGDDIPTHPMNDDGGIYVPPDPRFYLT